MKKKTTRPDKIQSVTETGAPVNSRFINATNAWNIYEKIRNEDSTDAQKRARIAGLIDGNRPYNEATLQAKGQSWRSNVNFREAESIRDSNAAAYWSLLIEVAQLVNVTLKHDPDDIREAEDEQIIAEEFTAMMFEWQGFFYNMMLHAGEMLTYGIGPVIWGDQFDWRFKAIPRGNFKIPPRTKSSIDKVDMFFVNDTMSVHELLKFTELPEIAKEMGWNVKEIKKVLIDMFWDDKAKSTTNKYSKSSWENTQQMIKNNDTGIEFDDADELQIVHAFIRNTTDRKISHYIIVEEEARSEYLLEAKSVHTDMSEVLNPFVYNIGDGWFRSIKGLGHRMFQSVEMSNRFINSTFDTSLMAGSVMVNSTGNKQDMRIMRIGPVTQLPEGMQIVEQRFQPNITQLLSARGMLQNIMNNNYGIYQKSNEGMLSPARTKAEVIIAEQKETRLLNFQIMQYYVHLDRLYKEIWRRIMNPDYPKDYDGYDAVAEFKKNCEERGVDPARWRNWKKIKIKATRTVGAGSPAIRQIVMDKMLSASAMMPPEGQQRVMIDYVAAYAGYDVAARYIPQRSKKQNMSMEHSMAMLENNDLSEGAQCMVSPEQNQEHHLDIHMPQLMELVQSVNQAMQQGKQLDPNAIIPFVEASIIHNSQHLEIMAIDPRKKNKGMEYTRMLAMANAMHKILLKMAEQQAKQQAKQQQENAATVEQARQQAPSEELRVKLAKVQGDMAINQMLAEHKIKIGEAKARSQIMIKTATARNNMMLKQQQAGMPVEDEGMSI